MCVLLAIVVEEAVILGAMSEFESLNSKTFCSITKTVIILRIAEDFDDRFHLDSSLSQSCLSRIDSKKVKQTSNC